MGSYVLDQHTRLQRPEFFVIIDIVSISIIIFVGDHMNFVGNKKVILASLAVTFFAANSFGAVSTPKENAVDTNDIVKQVMSELEKDSEFHNLVRKVFSQSNAEARKSWLQKVRTAVSEAYKAPTILNQTMLLLFMGAIITFSASIVSPIVNTYFECSFPPLLREVDFRGEMCMLNRNGSRDNCRHTGFRGSMLY